jgi:hypothetical protein
MARLASALGVAWKLAIEHAPCAAMTASPALSAAMPITAMAPIAPIANVADDLMPRAVTGAVAERCRPGVRRMLAAAARGGMPSDWRARCSRRLWRARSVRRAR